MSFAFWFGTFRRQEDLSRQLMQRRALPASIFRHDWIERSNFEQEHEH
jgi:hypothetical protein